MVKNGLLAWKEINDMPEAFDLLLSDIGMPEMDGFETCRRLKEADETRHIPVIFITARDLEEDVVTGFGVGGVDYITKPFREEEVLVRVETQVRIAARGKDD